MNRHQTADNLLWIPNATQGLEEYRSKPGMLFVEMTIRVEIKIHSRDELYKLGGSPIETVHLLSRLVANQDETLHETEDLDESALFLNDELRTDEGWAPRGPERV